MSLSRSSKNSPLNHVTSCPCLTCSIKIVQVGIKEVVYDKSYYMDAEVRYAMIVIAMPKLTFQIATFFKEAGVRLTRISLVSSSC